MPDIVVVTESDIVTVTQGETLVTVYDGRGLTGAAGAAGSSTLDGLTDTTITGVADGDLLKYSSASTQWVNTNKLDGGNF
jgi:hypothetical protein